MENQGDGAKGKEAPMPGRRLVRHGSLHERPTKPRLLRQVGYRPCSQWADNHLSGHHYRSGISGRMERRGQTIPCARATRGLRRPSLDARTEGTSQATARTWTKRSEKKWFDPLKLPEVAP